MKMNKRGSGGLPPIVRDANRLLLLTEEVVRRFSRYYKYTIGTDMRRQAMQLSRLANRAWRDKPNQAGHVARLLKFVRTSAKQGRNRTWKKRRGSPGVNGHLDAMLNALSCRGNRNSTARQ